MQGLAAIWLEMMHICTEFFVFSSARIKLSAYLPHNKVLWTDWHFSTDIFCLSNFSHNDWFWRIRIQQVRENLTISDVNSRYCSEAKG
jgi:hypothetical protein